MSEPSGNAIAQYFEGTAFIGERLMYCCGYASTDGKRHSAYWPSTAYFCPICGEIWAREILQHQFDYQPIPQKPWVVETRRCAQHGDGYLLVGKESELRHCSTPLLAREALLLCIRNPK